MGLQGAVDEVAAALAAAPALDAVASFASTVHELPHNAPSDPTTTAMRALLAEIADDPVGATDAIAKAHLPPPLVAAILRHTTELQAKTPGAAIPHLHRLDWRVDITVATSSIAPVWQPTVVLRFRLTDGKIRVTELPLQQFHELRYNTAKILQEMNQLERHPIMRLTQNGQTSM